MLLVFHQILRSHQRIASIPKDISHLHNLPLMNAENTSPNAATMVKPELWDAGEEGGAGIEPNTVG